MSHVKNRYPTSTGNLALSYVPRRAGHPRQSIGAGLWWRSAFLTAHAAPTQAADHPILPRCTVRLTRYLMAILILGVCGFPTMSEAADTERMRVYLSIRLGGALFVGTKPVPDIQVSRIAGQQLIAGALGVNLSQHWGVEVAADGYETDLELSGVGKIGEYAIWTVIPQVRWRYPLLDKRLSPYAVGGIGFGFTEFNDPTPRSINVRVEANDTTIVGALGGGLDYFVVGNIAVGVEAKYLIFRGANFQLNGRGSKADFDTVLMSGGLRIFFP